MKHAREVGDRNKHGQVLIKKTGQAGNHRFARLWVLRCEYGHEYGANSCDFHERRCPEPRCERGGGKPGLPL